MYSLQYSTTRREIWRWYWRAWSRRAGLWRFHLIISVTAGITFAVSRGISFLEWENFAKAAAAAAVCCLVLLPLWPQLKYKKQVRTLELDEHGYKTEIGKARGQRKWSEIRSIEDCDGTVIITLRNGNAMLIPNRAFGRDMERQRFVSDITQWQIRAAT